MAPAKSGNTTFRVTASARANADGTVLLVLDDFSLGPRYRETDEASRRADGGAGIITGQYHASCASGRLQHGTGMVLRRVSRDGPVGDAVAEDQSRSLSRTTLNFLEHHLADDLRRLRES